MEMSLPKISFGKNSVVSCGRRSCALFLQYTDQIQEALTFSYRIFLKLKRDHVLAEFKMPEQSNIDRV